MPNAFEGHSPPTHESGQSERVRHTHCATKLCPKEIEMHFMTKKIKKDKDI